MCVYLFDLPGTTFSVWRRHELSVALAGAAHPQLQLQLHRVPRSIISETHTHAHTHTGSLGNTTLPSLFLQSLLNALKSLDLSYNKIQDCAEFLKVPVFFLSAFFSLK